MRPPGLAVDSDWVEHVEVEPMADGGMGSLRLRVPDNPVVNQQFLREGSELQFNDKDGVPVIATLYVDHANMPFELDVWKVSSDPLLEIPAVLPPATAGPEAPLH